MLRQNAYPRTSLAVASMHIDDDKSGLRQSVARELRFAARVLLAPLALLAAALAGVVFVILLPVCGIATVAEATAKASWAFVRGAFRRSTRT